MDAAANPEIMSELITTAARGAAYYITLNRPAEGNVLTDAMVVRLTRLIAEAPSEAKVIVLRGAGKDFCLGRDIPALKREGQPKEALALREKNEAIFQGYNSFRTSPVPVVNVVQGRAFGFGCALAAMGDITIAAATSSFCLPEMAHGIMPGMAMSALVDRIPRKGLLYLTYSTEPVNAQQALALGLASAVVADDELEHKLATLVAALSSAPMAAVRGVKEFSRSTAGMDVNAASDFARNLHATINSSPELWH